MKNGKVTIKEVARAAGVSITTVSRVLNSQEGQMTEDTRQRILAAMDELHYVPNRLASSLKNERSHTLGVIVSNILNPFFTAVVRGIQDYVKPRGYEVFICNTDDDPKEEADYRRVLLSRRVDGLIVTNCGGDFSAYKKLVDQNYPLVLMDRRIKGLSCDSVVIDNAGICQKVMERLIGLGHRRIGVITPPLDHIEPRLDRVQGCRKALRKHGMELAPELIREVNFHAETAASEIRGLLALKPAPTALFVLNTFLAIRALEELDKLRVRIPDDLSFVMFDDPDWSEIVKPKIGAVRQPTYEIGKTAARLLLERIERSGKREEMVRMQAQFIERESTGARNPSAGRRRG